ncbi:hypothetical protein P9X10_00590 [Bacillus cereus]|nr:hypothetical protein [Bacillus cereus]
MIESNENTEIRLLDLEEGRSYPVSCDSSEILVERQGTKFKFIQEVEGREEYLVQTFDLKRLIHVLQENKKVDIKPYEEYKLEDVARISAILWEKEEGTHYLKSESNYATFQNWWVEGNKTKDFSGVLSFGEGETVSAFKVLINHPKYGLYTEHIEAPTEEKLKEYFENYYDKDARMSSYKQKEMASHNLKLSNMVDGKDYEVMADSDQTNDIIVLRKEGDWIYSTIRGGDFTTDVKHKYKLKEVLEIFIVKDYIDRIPFEDIDISYLKWVDSEIYANVVAYAEMPEEYVGIVEDLTEKNE